MKFAIICSKRGADVDGGVTVTTNEESMPLSSWSTCTNAYCDW